MKKTIAILLAFCLCVGLCACGSIKNENAGVSTDATTIVTDETTVEQVEISAFQQLFSYIQENGEFREYDGYKAIERYYEGDEFYLVANIDKNAIEFRVDANWGELSTVITVLEDNNICKVERKESFPAGLITYQYISGTFDMSEGENSSDIAMNDDYLCEKTKDNVFGDPELLTNTMREDFDRIMENAKIQIRMTELGITLEDIGFISFK